MSSNVKRIFILVLLKDNTFQEEVIKYYYIIYRVKYNE